MKMTSTKVTVVVCTEVACMKVAYPEEVNIRALCTKIKKHL